MTDGSKRSTSSIALRDEARFGAHRLPRRSAVLQQAAHGVAQQVGGGLVAGQQQPEQDRGDFVLASGARRRRSVAWTSSLVKSSRGRRCGREPGLRYSARRRPCPRRPRPGRLVGATEHEQQPVAAPRLDRATSASGTPSTLKMTSAGSSQVSARTMSTSGPCTRSSIMRTAKSRMKASMRATMRGVNARLARRRARVWAGGSALVSVGTER